MAFNNTLEFDTYKISYPSYARSKSSYGPTTIQVRLYQRGAPVGALVFRPDGSNLPQDYILNQSDIWLYYHEHHFPNLITILREEKPLYVFIRTDVNTSSTSGKLVGLGEISTSSEPIGEHEPR